MQEIVRIIRFLIRAAAILAIIAWTLLMAGAVQAWLNSGSIFQSLQLQLGDPELEAEVYNLLLVLQRMGLPALAVGWIVGIGIILVARAILLGIVGLAGRLLSPRARPAPAPLPPAPATSPDPVRPPAAGPWRRPPAAPASPPVLPPAEPAARKRPSSVLASPSVVDRAGRGDRPADPSGTVVERRPRGHMDR